MKRKHKDAMIAMGIKISALEHLLRNHGEAHMAQDLLPQFTALAKKVEKLEGDILPGVVPGKTSLWSRVINLERNKADASTLSGVAGDNINRRLADHDESIEALSETVDQLSTCKCQAGEQMLKRIATIETIQNRDGATLNQHFERISNQTTKINALERTVYNSPFSKIVMEEYAENIKTLVRDVDTLKIQMGNLLPVHRNVCDKVLSQENELKQLRKAARLQGQHLVKLEKKVK